MAYSLDGDSRVVVAIYRCHRGRVHSCVCVRKGIYIYIYIYVHDGIQDAAHRLPWRSACSDGLVRWKRKSLQLISSWLVVFSVHVAKGREVGSSPSGRWLSGQPPLVLSPIHRFRFDEPAARLAASDRWTRHSTGLVVAKGP
jgi:hypothetical protein